KAAGRNYDTRVTMENIPREYPFCPTDRRFFSTEAPTYLLLHIYYSAEILEACQVNLSALVADGVHDLQPDTTNKTGQLYFIHGMMANPEHLWTSPYFLLSQK
ncbi:hypothetical protein V3C99_001459, partial [Haemonchus contortus]